MKATIRTESVQDYPYLGYYSHHDLIVLFTAPGEGFVLQPGDSDLDIGDTLHCDYQESEDFTRFRGELILENQ